MADERVPQSTPPTPPKRNVSPEIIVAALLAIVLVIFIVQNDERVDVDWFVFNRRAALWTVILVSAVLGYVIGQLVEYGLKRRRRNHHRDQSRA